MSEGQSSSASIKLLALLGLGFAIVYIIIFHDTGIISAGTQVFGGALCLYCFMNPKAGLYILGFFCFYLDFVKKLAVVYGVASMQTVIEVLALQMIALGCIALGAFIRLLLFEQRLNRWIWWTFVGCVGITILVFGLYFSNGLVNAVQGSINNVGYAFVAVALMAYLEGKKEMLRYLDYFFWLSIPWCIYGLYQYFAGFPEFEWEYAKTWLSPISSMQMLAAENPRPFGFASGPGGYGVLGFIMAYAGWRLLDGQGNRFFMSLGCVIIFVALVFSAQRTILILPFTCAACYLAFKSKAGTLCFYGAGALIFLCGVVFAEALMPKLSAFDSQVNTRSEWANRVIRVSTLSNRVRGWERLKKAETYTLIGKRWEPGYEADADFTSEDHHHDLLNTILDNVGVVGLLAIISFLGLSLAHLHGIALSLPKGADKNFTTFLLSTLVVFTGTMSVGGNNLTSTPNNLVYWTLVACLLNMKYLIATNRLFDWQSLQVDLPVESKDKNISPPVPRLRPSRMPQGWVKMP